MADTENSQECEYSSILVMQRILHHLRRRNTEETAKQSVEVVRCLFIPFN